VVVPGKGHATLTFDYPLALERGIDTRQLVLEHIRSRLVGEGRTAADSQGVDT